MKIFITGINGAVGWNLANLFHSEGYDVLGTFRQAQPPNLPGESSKPAQSYYPLDLGDTSLASSQLEAIPQDLDAIIHCAAFTDVNLCQREMEMAERINTEGTRQILNAAKDRNAFLIYLSTDFVFPGSGLNYREDSATGPRGIYGQTKLKGEDHVLEYESSAVIRFTPLDHPLHLPHHSNTFVRWLQSQKADSPPLRLFTDKTFSPVSAVELFELSKHILTKVNQNSSDRSGVWHSCSKEILSVFEAGAMVRDYLGLPVQLEGSKFPDNEYGAIRPQHSGLISTRYPSKPLLSILSQFHKGA